MPHQAPLHRPGPDLGPVSDPGPDLDLGPDPLDLWTMYRMYPEHQVQPECQLHPLV